MNKLETVASRTIKLIDLTSLNASDNDNKIIELCKNATTTFGNVASICVYPRFISTARNQLNSQGTPDIKVVTVTNFPHGNSDINIAISETKQAVEYGADEVDVTFPYRALISGDEEVGFRLIKECKSVCENIPLKVIIESGELKTPALIEKAAEISIKAGADFIKTSTGKVPTSATVESAKIILSVIEKKRDKYSVGLKVSGGIKTVDNVKEYLDVADKAFGCEWTNNKDNFRVGASTLLNELIEILNENDKQDNTYISGRY